MRRLNLLSSRQLWAPEMKPFMASVVPALQIAAKEHEADTVTDEVVDSSLLAESRPPGEAADVGEPCVRGKLDHHQAAAPLAKSGARRIDEIHPDTVMPSVGVDRDQMNARCPTRSGGVAEHNESNRRTRTACDERLILIGRSHQRTFERREHRSSVGRIREYRDDERSGSGGIRVGERAEGGRHWGPEPWNSGTRSRKKTSPRLTHGTGGSLTT
jgi:hypothetical protein